MMEALSLLGSMALGLFIGFVIGYHWERDVPKSPQELREKGLIR
jgi:hypothetical protein